MIRVNQIYLTLDEEKEQLKEKVAHKLRMPIEDILDMQIYRESIDARKQEVRFSYTVDVNVRNEKKYIRYKDVMETPKLDYDYPVPGVMKGNGKVIVAGFGPAGMFAALLLAQMGYCPYVVERGGNVDERVLKVEDFWEHGTLDQTCNVQFGEGGAGTFSDGKLTTRSKDLRSRKVLEEFVKFGAPEEILYQAYPHIGTDLLRGIVKKMREEIIRLGGEVHFHAQLTDFQMEVGQITSVKVNEEWTDCAAVLLAIGHSARDTFTLLKEKQLAMEAKAFAVGVRIEHPQTLINEAQYKTFANHPKLKAAEYRLTHKTVDGRGAYTFCMCPGGSVVASASEENGIVVNGMSEHARDKENANSAILVNVGPDDFGHDILDGVHFQRQLEQKAFQMGQGNYRAPAQLVKDYLANIPSTKIGNVQPTYQPGVTLCDLHELFPSYINDALEEAILAFDRKLKGFAMGNAIMTGVETRSSSPLRILRDHECLQSETLSNLYPCGEGAGYAGGIVSAAIDGLRCAEKIIETFAPAK